MAKRWRRSVCMGAAPEAGAAELNEADLLYEENVIRNAYSLKYWTRYIEAKRAAPARQRNVLAERAVKYLPGSYKLWRPYLFDRVAQVKECAPEDDAIIDVNRAFERALVYMHKMPRVWEDYLGFLLTQHRIGDTRHAFDRALRALPITQHDRIWTLYLTFAKGCPVKETAVRVYRRCVPALCISASLHKCAWIPALRPACSSAASMSWWFPLAATCSTSPTASRTTSTFCSPSTGWERRPRSSPRC